MVDGRLGQPDSDHITAGNNNTYENDVMRGHRIVFAIPCQGDYSMMNIITVASNTRCNFPNIRIGLMVGVNGSVPSTKTHIRLGDIVVSSPEEDKSDLVQYNHGKKIHGQDFKLTGQSGHDFLGRSSMAFTEREPTMINRLLTYENFSDIEKERYVKTPGQPVRCQMGNPASRCDDDTRGQL